MKNTIAAGAVPGQRSQLPRRGPLEESRWPETLQARVVTAGACPRVQGYDVEADLACHYGWTDLAYLALTGELPSDTVAAAFNVAALFLGAASTAQASVHASVLARLCDASTSATIGVAAIALGEQTRRLLDEHVELLEWCSKPDQLFPTRHVGTDESERASLERLRDALGPTGLFVPGLEQAPTRDAALILLLHACGLRSRPQLEAAITLFRLPTALAEAFAERPCSFSSYPINLPRFVLEEDP